MAYTIPDRYPFAVEVPPRGASCATCRFVGLRKGTASCANGIYIERMGTAVLPRQANRWCCSLWTAKGKDGAVAIDDVRRR